MKLAKLILALALAGLMAACGGGDANPGAGGAALAKFDASSSPRSDVLKAPAAPAAAAVRLVSVDEMLDWAESIFPQFFPTHEATQRYDIYSYRHYANGNYVGISDAGIVVGMGPYVGSLDSPVSLGVAADYACRAKPSACTTESAYTIFTEALTTQAAAAQVFRDGLNASITIPNFGTASTVDDYANVTWTGSVGGALRNDGNLLMFCTGTGQKNTRVGLSSSFVRVTDFAELANRSFLVTDCFHKDHPDNTRVFSFGADSSMQVPSGEIVPTQVRNAFFSEQGFGDAGGTFRGQAWKVLVNGQPQYKLVFLNHDIEAGEDSIQFADQQ